VHTLSVPVVSEMSKLFRTSDMDAVLGFIMRSGPPPFA
jgi:hypothetical protein